MTEQTPIDIAALSAPLSEQAPCGDNLEYDPQFLALEEAGRGKPEVQYGSTITAATPPDWQTVRALALQLMRRSRDLRLAVALIRAQLGLDGVQGLAAGLALLTAWLARFWDDIHPRLDPDDDNDPVLRVNVLAALCQQDELLRELREAPLVRVRGLGSFSLRDIDLAGGDAAPPPGQQKISLAVIDAAFAEAEPGALELTCTSLHAAAGHARSIEQLLMDKVGPASALDLSPLTALLRRASAALQPHLRDAGAGQQSPAVDAEGEAVGARPGQAASVPRGEQINSRAEVTRALEKLCAYYAAHEPSSPVPLLLQRARKLVDMGFADLLQELAPDGLAQLAQVSGVRNEA
ncbi:type VI secretion system protein TssA [Duganella sp. FT94W]|uniref:Type VI secretion system protein TssA n=1 Tax=Duganella lactea TaxID=2692173 RepID=A0ABW9V860_9BURK|nr:type VI secretion system protein TssA [Duganella lactea]MYM34965.1 type VI secretion system protein TssA [Duganella lactea]